MDVKRCTKCKNLRSVSDFRVRPTPTVNGEPMLQSWCNECKRVYDRLKKRQDRGTTNPRIKE